MDGRVNPQIILSCLGYKLRRIKNWRLVLTNENGRTLRKVSFRVTGLVFGEDFNSVTIETEKFTPFQITPILMYTNKYALIQRMSKVTLFAASLEVATWDLSHVAPLYKGDSLTFTPRLTINLGRD